MYPANILPAEMMPSPWLILIAGGAGLGGLLLLSLSALLIYKLVNARQGYSAPNAQVGRLERVLVGGKRGVRNEIEREEVDEGGRKEKRGMRTGEGRREKGSWMREG